MARYPSTVMVSIVCPWDDDERLDEAIFRRATRHALASGFRHLYVFGTAGEGYAVDTARFREVAEVLRDETAGTDAQPMVGVIGLSTANVLERLGVAHDLGFRAFQISLPSWSPLDRRRGRRLLRGDLRGLPRFGRSCTTTRSSPAAWSAGSLYRRDRRPGPEPGRHQDHDRATWASSPASSATHRS